MLNANVFGVLIMKQAANKQHAEARGRRPTRREGAQGTMVCYGRQHRGRFSDENGWAQAASKSKLTKLWNGSWVDTAAGT